MLQNIKHMTLKQLALTMTATILVLSGCAKEMTVLLVLLQFCSRLAENIRELQNVQCLQKFL